MGFPLPVGRAFGALQDRELDELVTRIGDAFLARMGPSADAPAPSADKPIGCACEHGDTEPAVVTAFRPPAGWERQAIELVQLDGEATSAEIQAVAQQAARSELNALTVLPAHVSTAVRALRESATKVVAAVGYPHGATAGPLRLAEAELALGQGAGEIEWTAPLGALREGLDDLVYGELRGAVELARAAAAELSLAVEVSNLEQHRKLTAAVLARLAGADGVAVTAGRSAHGRALPADVASVRRALGDGFPIKACGGVKAWAAVGALISAGADFVGIDDLSALTR